MLTRHHHGTSQRREGQVGGAEAVADEVAAAREKRRDLVEQAPYRGFGRARIVERGAVLLDEERPTKGNNRRKASRSRRGSDGATVACRSGGRVMPLA